MAILKQIKFGESVNQIAKTIVKPKDGGVIAVSPTGDRANDDSEQLDYSYDLDVNVDDKTIVKSGGKLAVGTVPAEKVSVAAGTGLESTEAQSAFKELKDKIDKVEGAAKSYTIVKKTEGLATNVKEQYQLQDEKSEPVGEPINIYKDGSLDSVELVDQKLVFKYNLATGKQQTVEVDVSNFLAESEFKDGLVVDNHVVKVKVDTTSEGFLTVGANGVKLSGVQEAIDAAVAGKNVSAEGDSYVKASASDNKVTVATQIGNLTFTQGSGSDSTLSGTANKLIDSSDAAQKVSSFVNARIGEEIAKLDSAITSTDGINVQVKVTEVDGKISAVNITADSTASKANLDAEIADREAADNKLTQGLTAEVTRAKDAETSIDSVVGLTKAADGETRTYTNEGEYIGKKAAGTNTVASDIKALDTKLKTVADNLAAVRYKVSGTTLEFFGIDGETVA